MKKALDQQVRYQQECVVREREEDLEWVRREQERIVIWNEEEKKKIEQTTMKNNAIHHQRQQQLREVAALRAREKEEQGHYDLDILRCATASFVLLTHPPTASVPKAPSPACCATPPN